MQRKELLVVLILGLLVALAATVRLFSTPLGSSATKGGTTTKPPLRPYHPTTGAKNGSAGPHESVLWPPPTERVAPRNPTAARLFAAAEAAAAERLFAPAVGIYKHVRDKFPDDPVAEMALLRLGQCCTLAERTADAAGYYEQFIKLYPNSEFRPLPLVWSAEALIQAHNTDLARSRLSEVIEKHPDSPFVERAKARLAALEGQAPKAP